MLYQVKEGQEFVLLRTGEVFKFLRRDRSSPKGTQYVVTKDVEETTLHPNCYVSVI